MFLADQPCQNCNRSASFSAASNSAIANKKSGGQDDWFRVQGTDGYTKLLDTSQNALRIVAANAHGSRGKWKVGE